jgi:hypothetical protein
MRPPCAAFVSRTVPSARAHSETCRTSPHARGALRTNLRAAGRTTMSCALCRCGLGVLRAAGGWRSHGFASLPPSSRRVPKHFAAWAMVVSAGASSGKPSLKGQPVVSMSSVGWGSLVSRPCLWWVPSQSVALSEFAGGCPATGLLCSRGTLALAAPPAASGWRDRRGHRHFLGRAVLQSRCRWVARNWADLCY